VIRGTIADYFSAEKNGSGTITDYVSAGHAASLG
jgi:hypothetical protein